MVQKHDNRVRVSFFCHPEPGPEASSGSKDFGISVLVLRIWVLEPRPYMLNYYQEKIRISKISEEIFDYADYESITQILNALNIRKICLITFLKSV